MGVTDDLITHDGFNLNFESNHFTKIPQLLASLATTDGSDPAVLRYNNLTKDGTQLTAQEDQSFDEEINHTTERASFFGIQGSDLLTGTQFDPLVANSLDSQVGFNAQDPIVV